MCGIGGVLSPTGVGEPIKLLTDALRHRGPDDVGMAELRSKRGGVAGAFGHRRLSIIDLSSAGHQPMFTAGGRYCITYNGEIYNYQELRLELEQEGAVFRTSCDTEVLLVGWERHGASFLPRLRGMYAFAVWDAESDTAHLVRDPFGIKPLYVSDQAGTIIFGSEVRSLLATNRIPRRLNTAAVESYLATGSVAEPLTIIEGISAVPPGCVVEVSRAADGFMLSGPQRFFAAFTLEGEADCEPRSHVHRVRNALRESVRYHLVSDLPVGVFLSGGIDSSAIAGLAREVSDERLESFTVTFAEAEFSEAAPARAVARRFNTRHHEVPLSGGDLLSALPDFFAAMDQPSLDGLNTFVVSRAVRDFGIKVVLSGLGGDELFGGYPSFRRAQLIAPFWKMPAAIRRIGASASRPFGGRRADRLRARLGDGSAAFAAYHGSRTLFGDRQLAALTSSPAARPISTQLNPDGVKMDGLGLLQQVSLYELTGYMRNTLLRDSDVFSMAHSLELRVPLVDVQVAQAAISASRALKLKRGILKPLLVEAIRDLLPPELINRPKKGFTLPFETWMRDELRDEVDCVLSGTRAQTVGLNPSTVHSIWRQFLHREPGVNWSRPWALYTLLRWARQNEIEVT